MHTNFSDFDDDDSSIDYYLENQLRELDVELPEEIDLEEEDNLDW